jgi:radical SAM superfamily enzyme YgiQ (UPF0313 family)
MQKIKVGLVQINNSFSNQNYFPYSVGILQAYAQKYLKDKELFEFSLPLYKRISLKDALKQLDGCDIVFFSAYTWNINISLEIARQLKTVNNNILVVFGGPQIPIRGIKEFLKKYRFIDLACHGEGEDSFIRFINEYKSGRKHFDDIDGFAYRADNKINIKCKMRFIENLDSLPFPAYDLVNMSDYDVDTSDWFNPKNLSFKTTIPMISSRSCPNKCNFCSMYHVMGPRWRARSPENVVDEIEFLYNAYNHRHFSFMDDNLTLRKSHVLSICRLIKERKLNIEFETPNGISIRTLDKEVLDALVSAGLVRMSLAIESGSDFIRNKVMGKNLKEENILEIINLVKQYKGIYVRAFFIIGMPEETNETLEATYNMIKKIDVNRIYLHNIIPYPGTAVYQQALRDNLLVNISPDDFYKTDKLYLTNYDSFFIKPYKLTTEELITFRKRCEHLINDLKEKRMSKAHGE